MGYQVKWVEDNLGVSRKALRTYEKFGLMPRNQDGQHRNYDDSDIERIWTIKVLQGMGYTLREIATMAQNDDFDFEASIDQKIQELEQRKVEIEKFLGYAKTIKFTGSFPYRPKELGEVTFSDFYEHAINEWNMATDSRTAEHTPIIEKLMTLPLEEWEDTDFGHLLAFFESWGFTEETMGAITVENTLIKEIIRRADLGTAHSEVQMLIRNLAAGKVCARGHPGTPFAALGAKRRG